MKRVALPATIATIVLACAVAAAWTVAVRYVASSIATQARLAGELLDARVAVDERLARTLLRPGIHIELIDRSAGSAISADSVGISTRALPFGPPPGFPGGGPLGALGAGPPGSARPQGPFTTLALALARVRPIAVDRDDVTVEVAPDVRELTVWLGLCALALVGGVLVIAGVAAARWTAIDRDERRALEAAIAERRDAADRYQRFLAETGHELRTPLTVMAGYVDILRARKTAGSVDARIVDGMHAETLRMRVLVEKMMTLARLESDAAVPRLLDIATAARDAAATLQRRYPQSDVRVEASQTASIVIDADDYAAALGNVLENAVKYAPNSPILVETAVGNGRATTSIVDRGPGISSEDREKIFGRFYRGRNHSFGEGLGLGLAIVKRVVERWHGTVDCESEAGRTIFRLTFPLADEEVYGIAR
jgi:signal transduction histidine kinase